MPTGSTKFGEMSLMLSADGSISGGYEMNEFISNNYKNTDDALLVQKWFGRYLPCVPPELNQILFGDRIDKLLEIARMKEAKELEGKQNGK